MPDKQGKSAGTKLSAVLGGHEPSRALIKAGADIGGKGIIIAHLKAAIEQQGVDVPHIGNSSSRRRFGRLTKPLKAHYKRRTLRLNAESLHYFALAEQVGAAAEADEFGDLVNIGILTAA